MIALSEQLVVCSLEWPIDFTMWLLWFILGSIPLWNGSGLLYKNSDIGCNQAESKLKGLREFRGIPFLNWFMHFFMIGASAGKMTNISNNSFDLTFSGPLGIAPCSMLSLRFVHNSFLVSYETENAENNTPLSEGGLLGPITTIDDQAPDEQEVTSNIVFGAWRS